MRPTATPSTTEIPAAAMPTPNEIVPPSKHRAKIDRPSPSYPYHACGGQAFGGVRDSVESCLSNQNDEDRGAVITSVARQNRTMTVRIPPPNTARRLRMAGAQMLSDGSG